MIRAEISSNFDSGESAQIAQIKFDPNSASMFRPNRLPIDEDLVSNKPIEIREYEFYVATTTLTQMWQSHYDSSDEANATNWTPSDINFQLPLKQNKLVAGNKSTYVTDWDAATLSDHYVAHATSSNLDYRIGKITFKASRYRKGKKKGQWRCKPIRMNSFGKDCMSWHVANVGNTDSAHYYAWLKIKDWRQYS